MKPKTKKSNRPISLYAPADLRKKLEADAERNHRELSPHCVWLLGNAVKNKEQNV